MQRTANSEAWNPVPVSRGLETHSQDQPRGKYTRKLNCPGSLWRDEVYAVSVRLFIAAKRTDPHV